jgi:hypothetical protein
LDLGHQQIVVADGQVTKGGTLLRSVLQVPDREPGRRERQLDYGSPDSNLGAQDGIGTDDAVTSEQSNLGRSSFFHSCNN